MTIWAKSGCPVIGQSEVNSGAVGSARRNRCRHCWRHLLEHRRSGELAGCMRFGLFSSMDRLETSVLHSSLLMTLTHAVVGFALWLDVNGDAGVGCTAGGWHPRGNRRYRAPALQTLRPARQDGTTNVTVPARRVFRSHASEPVAWVAIACLIASSS